MELNVRSTYLTTIHLIVHLITDDPMLIFIFFMLSHSFDRVVAKISAIEKDAGLNLPMNDNEEISKVSLGLSLLVFASFIVLNINILKRAM
jgi:hypothetical protein